jgi:hypothetical protein
MAVSLLGGVRHPKIYAYTIDVYAETAWVGPRKGKGLIKVGETQRNVDRRIKEQLEAVKMPVTTPYKLFLTESAITENGEVFTDKEIHRVLEKAGAHNLIGEWYECTEAEIRAAIASVRTGSSLATWLNRQSFAMRPEQIVAVEQTAAYLNKNADPQSPPHFLWNAKMRFGKTFTTYQLAKKLGWTRILVLTYKPAVEGAWREDLLHIDFPDWRFKGKSDPVPDLESKLPLVWFASFQDVLGHDAVGNPKIRNEGLYLVDWDAVVIDEYHFGAWRDAARSLYIGDPETGTTGDPSEKAVVDTPDLDEDFSKDLEESLELIIHNYLYLSGTPFRALTEGEFLEDQVFNWTYSDEQRAKQAWRGTGNPYASLPKMHLLAYEMPEKLKEIALNNFSEFSLTEFFRTKKTEDGIPKFIHENEVQKWIDLLRGQNITDLWTTVSTDKRPPLPFEDKNLLTALQHTVWYLPSVDACVAMKTLLSASHNIFFREYEIVDAAGTKAGMGEKALPPVRKAIGNIPQDTKSITLSCGKLMTGVTVPAWAGIFMLRELQSPETYFQAAFRVQSPWSYKYANPNEGGEEEAVVKEHCYVIDFSPNRALRQIVDYATRLRSETAAERNDEKAIDEFMEFLPVLSFTGYHMEHLHAGDVIDYLTKGISSSMLARRWNSPELLTLDIGAMKSLMANPQLLASLEQIEMFRNISDDLTAMISSNEELRKKKLANEKLTPAETKVKDEAVKRREDLKEKLRRFLTRIPAFMYLTDDREKSVSDIITQIEPSLFERVTGLKLKDFEQLVDARVFNETKMNDAVWKFRSFEEPSLTYVSEFGTHTQGGWNVRRDDRFAKLIDRGALSFGDKLTTRNQIQESAALVTEDYGLLVEGIRHDSPDVAASAIVENIVDGWEFWGIEQPGEGWLNLRTLLSRV